MAAGLKFIYYIFESFVKEVFRKKSSLKILEPNAPNWDYYNSSLFFNDELVRFVCRRNITVCFVLFSRLYRYFCFDDIDCLWILLRHTLHPFCRHCNCILAPCAARCCIPLATSRANCSSFWGDSDAWPSSSMDRAFLR